MTYGTYRSEEKAIGYALAFLYSILVALFWFPAFAFRLFARFHKEIGTENWPRADGVIASGEVKVVHGWILDYAVAELDYSYRVQGEYYAGHNTRQYCDEQVAWTFVDSRRGKSVLVRYRDDNAAVSVLRSDDQDPFRTEDQSPTFFSQLWRHWRDECKSGNGRDRGQGRQAQDEQLDQE